MILGKVEEYAASITVVVQEQWRGPAYYEGILKPPAFCLKLNGNEGRHLNALLTNGRFVFFRPGGQLKQPEYDFIFRMLTAVLRAH